MITTSQMYWLTRLDSVKETLIGFTQLFLFFMGILAVAAVLMYSVGTFTGNDSFEMFSGKTDDELESIHARLRRVSARCVVAVFLMLFASGAANMLAVLIPSTREMAAIIIVPKIANFEKVQQAGNKLYDLAVEWMDELKPNKNNNKKGADK